MGTPQVFWASDPSGQFVRGAHCAELLQAEKPGQPSGGVPRRRRRGPGQELPRRAVAAGEMCAY